MLGHVRGNPGISFSELARRSRITVQSAHAAVASFVEAGLVEDATAHAGAASTLQVTPEGEALLGRATEVVAELDARFAVQYPELTEALRAHMTRIMRGSRITFSWPEGYGRSCVAVHPVVAGILFVGPVAVTTSMCSRYAPVAVAPGGANASSATPTPRDCCIASPASLRASALAVPVIGLVLATVQGRATEIWVVVAMALTAVAGGLLALQIVPRQQRALDAPDDGAHAAPSRQ